MTQDKACKILGIPLKANREEAKKARNALAKKYAPDKNPHIKDPVRIAELNQKCAEINEAWKCLQKIFSERQAQAEARRKAKEEQRRKAAEEARRKAGEEQRRKAAMTHEEACKILGIPLKANREEAKKARNALVKKYNPDYKDVPGGIANLNRNLAKINEAWNCLVETFKEDERKQKAAEEARRKAEEEQRRKAAEEARRKAEEERQRKAAQEAQSIMTHEEACKILGIPVEANRKEAREARNALLDKYHPDKNPDVDDPDEIDELNRKCAEINEAWEYLEKIFSKRQAQEEARRKAEEERKQKAAEEARRKAEEEQKQKAAEEARRKEEQRRKAEEERKQKAVEEARRKAEEERRRKAAEEARRKTEAERQRKAAKPSLGRGSYRRQPRIWQAKPFQAKAAAQLSVDAGVSPLTAQALLNRGIDTASAAQAFLEPSFSHLHDPMRLPGMEAAVERVRRALDKGEKIVVYGDYDVDGATSVALLMDALTHLGAEPEFYIPNRFREGYGMNAEAVDKIQAGGGDLLITVDCGITARDRIDEAKRLGTKRVVQDTLGLDTLGEDSLGLDAPGMDVIVVDHHAVDDLRLPLNTVARVNPKLQDHDYPYEHLAGVGLAFKLAHALIGGDVESSDFLRSLLDLTALGTIADVADLTGENRVLAKLGLEVMSERRRPGIRALCGVSGIHSTAPIRSGDVGFRLGPRLNAAGRLETAHQAVELLRADSEERAREIAEDLNEKNQRRREIQDAVVKDAEAYLRKNADLKRDAAILIAKDGWNSGVVGIAAARLAERYWRPTTLIALDGEIGRGSARSIPEFHVQKALMECREHMATFGGHAAAAGMTVKREKVKDLREAFLRIARARLSEEDLRPKLKLEAVLSLDALTVPEVEELSMLEPFGEGNPPIVVGVRGLRAKGTPLLMGKDKAHLAAELTDGNRTVRVVSWRGAEYATSLRTPKAEVNVAGRVEINEYKGRKKVQLTAEDWKIRPPLPGMNMKTYPPAPRAVWLRVEDARGVNKQEYLQRWLTNREGAALVYVRDKASLEQAQEILKEHDTAAFCSRKTRMEERRTAVDRLLNGELDAVVSCVSLTEAAESAWEALRAALFCHPPEDIETFFLQTAPLFAGWGKGEPSEAETRRAVLLFNENDIERARRLYALARPDKSALREIYRPLASQTAPILEMDWMEALSEPLQAGFPHAKSVFEEMDLYERIGASNGGRYRAKDVGRKDIEASPTYRRGRVDRLAFEIQSRFWAKATAQDVYEALRTHRREGISHER